MIRGPACYKPRTTLAKTRLGWKPTLSFKGLVEMMVDADLGRLRRANP